MSTRHYFLLYVLSLTILILVAQQQVAPGYMDAEYYFAGGLQLVRGQGFSEPYLWNYLSDPPGLPAPSHAYWMPLASLLAALSMIFSGAETFAAARVPFILLAAAVPPLTSALSYTLRSRRDLALLAGILAAISGFYLPFLSTTATFAPYMFLGAVFFLLAKRVINPIAITHSDLNAVERSSVSSSTPPPDFTSDNLLARTHIFSSFNQPAGRFLFSLGIVVGLMYLTRSDGLLYLLLAIIVAIIHTRKLLHHPHEHNSHPEISSAGRRSLFTANLSLKLSLPSITSYLTSTTLLLLGFFISTLPWFIRNIFAFSSPFPPGASYTLWLTNYDQLFSYPASVLSFDHWWSSGISAIFNARLWSLSQNLQTTLGVQGLVFLLPLILIASWRLRHDPVVRLGALAYLFTLVAMTLVFPFAGARGGFFHSGAAFQPLFWALAPIGLENFVSWGSSLRGWRSNQALQVFSVGLVALALLLTALTTLPRLLPEHGGEAPWNQGQAAYSRIEAALVAAGASDGDVVLVNNPPGYFLASGRPSLVIPDGEPSTTLTVADRYSASYLLLDQHLPQGLKELYQNPTDHPYFDYITNFESTHIFKIVGD